MADENDFIATNVAMAEAQSQQQEDFNLVGPSTGADLIARQQVAAEEPTFSLTQPSLFGRAVANTPVINFYEYAKRQLIAHDPEFDLSTRVEDIQQTVPGRYWHRFAGVQSDAELEELREQINQELEDEELLALSGVKGLTATLLAEVINPVNYVPFTASATGPKAVAGMRRLGITSTRAQGITYGALAGAEAGALSATVSEVSSVTPDLSVVPAAAMSGFVLGGGLGGVGTFEDAVNKSVDKFVTTYKPRSPRKLITPHAQVGTAVIGDPTVGAAAKTINVAAGLKSETLVKVREAQKYLQDSAPLVDTDIGIGEDLYQISQKLPLFQTTSDKLSNSGSAIGEMLAHKLMESPSGKFRNNSSASMMAAGYVGHIAAPVTANQHKLYKMWLQETKQTHSVENFRSFLRESEEDMQAWYHDGIRAYKTEAIKQFNDLRNEAAKRSRRVLKGEDGEVSVRGSEDLQDKDGWSPVRWSQEGVDRVIDAFKANYPGMDADTVRTLSRRDGMLAIEDALTRSYQRMYPGVSPDDLRIWAKAVIRRTRAMSLGIDTSLIRLLDEEGIAFGKQMLIDSGVSERTAQRLIEELRGLKKDDTKIKILKSRNEVDLREPIVGTNLRLMDLTELDHAKTWSHYSRVAGYNAGLARAGFPDKETLSDYLDAMQDELDALGKQRLSEEDVNFIKTMFTGRALSRGINPWLRRAIAASNLALLNGQGITQLAETGLAMGYFGMETYLKFAGKELQDIFDKKSIPAMKEMSLWGTHIEGEEAILMPQLSLDDWKAEIGTAAQLGAFIDNSLIKGRSIQQKITGFEFIKNAQQRIVTRLILQKFANVAKGVETIPDARMFDLGIGTKKDLELWDRLMENFRQAEYNEAGELVSLRPDNFSYEDFRDLGNLVRRSVSQHVQKMERGEELPWVSTDVGHVLSNLKTFTLLSLQKQTIRSLRNIDPETLAMWTYGFLTAGMTYAAKEVLSGREDLKLAPDELAKGAFGLGSTTGSIAMVADPLGAMLGLDELKFNNYSRPGVAGSTIVPMPPVIPTVERMAHIPESLFSVMIGQTDKQDVTALQTLPIIGNFPGMGYLWQAIKRDIEEEEREAKRQQNN